MAIDQQYGVLAMSNKAVTDNIKSVKKNDEVLESTKKMLKLDKIGPLREVSDRLNKLMD
jgi:hypothetical protein